MNDSKYGWDKPDNHTLRLTLLHTPETKNNYPYQDRQDLGYHTFTYSLVGHAGGLDKAQVVKESEVLNQRLKLLLPRNIPEHWAKPSLSHLRTIVTLSSKL
mgnify:CR=1 FL=1